MSFNFSLQSVSSSDFWLLPKPADVSTIDAVEATYSFESEITISYEKKEVSVVLSTLVKPTEEYATYLLGITVKVVFNLHEMEQHVDKVLQSIPDELLNSLINVTLGSTRGILLERCRDTYFENTFLPLVNPAEVPRKSNESMVFYRIVKLYNEGNMKEADLVMDKAIEVYPNIADFYNIKGVFLQNIEKNGAKAIEYYKKAIALNPNADNSYNNCGTAYNDLNLYQEAIEHFEKAIALNSNNADYYNNCGVTYNSLKNHEKALENYQKALSVNPNHLDIYFNIACLQRLTKDKTKALSYLQQAIDLDIKHQADAQTDADFEWLWDDADFKKITAA